MSEWTKQRLEQMIADRVEEHLSLDYKRADSLAKADVRKAEVTKDVSSFANSSGGVLIYGVAEFRDEARRHLPERLDPIQRNEISKEWLDQVVQTIQPRIEGVVIHSVTISEQDNTVCYVVEVPQSHTAHMARDNRYHKRHNFTTLAMEDYEVRDVMNRRTYPRIRGFIYVNRNTSRTEAVGMVLVRLENVGRVMARHVMVELELPINLEGWIAVDPPVLSKTTAEGNCHHFRLALEPGAAPIFPGSDVTLTRKLHRGVKFLDNNGNTPQSTRQVKVSIFADEMPPIRTTLDIAPVVLGWTPVAIDFAH
ncbi:MAG: ATP-binding protein [Proteobacteria bacterium]|nr:ATP-binding protein [Pseudomonadota bacterium]